MKSFHVCNDFPFRLRDMGSQLDLRSCAGEFFRDGYVEEREDDVPADAWVSSRTSLRSAIVRPSLRRPSSRSACSTQRRIAVADGSNSFASRSGLRPARTNSTIRALNSGAYLRPLPG